LLVMRNIMWFLPFRTSHVCALNMLPFVVTLYKSLSFWAALDAVSRYLKAPYLFTDT
jgi:hypothetical protein